MFDWIGDFFKAMFNLIPKIIYLLYASCACVLDVLQLFFRKLAGLDVYYIDGVAYSGDLLTNFIGSIFGINFNNTQPSYPALTTVFYSMIIFGVIICFVSVFISIIKAHYSYDGKSTPIQFVRAGGKALLNMVAVPLITILGLFVSQALLTALDSITSVSSSTVEEMFGGKAAMKNYFEDVTTSKGATGLASTGGEAESTFLYYDIFGFGGAIAYGPDTELTWLDKDIKKLVYIGAKNQTFSGSLFITAAYNANRVRLGQYNTENCTGMEDIFANAKNTKNGEDENDKLARMIDAAFANNLHLKNVKGLQNKYDSKKYFTNYYVSAVKDFSKFNVGAVWFFYDLWNFNFLVGFAGVVVCVSIFINIVFGMMARLITCLVLFLIAPPLFGLAPLDGGKAAKGWRENFMKQALMAYGAVVGMNLVMMILPYLNDIDFFNIPVADYLARTLLIITGLITIKSVIAVVSGLVGGEDANKSGEGVAKEVGSTVVKAGKAAVTAGKAGGLLAQGAAHGVAGAINTVGVIGGLGLGVKNKIQQAHAQSKANKQKDKHDEASRTLDSYMDKNGMDGVSDDNLSHAANMVNSGADKERFIQEMMDPSRDMNRELAENLYNDLSKAKEDGKLPTGVRGTINSKDLGDLRDTISNQALERGAEAGAKLLKYENKVSLHKTTATNRFDFSKSQKLQAKQNFASGLKFTGKGAYTMGSVYDNAFAAPIKEELKKKKDKKKEEAAKAAQKRNDAYAMAANKKQLTDDEITEVENSLK